tara:strand:- start:1251 stop:1688 length:438 start_codon:yes stop_codon:yes gene_type:complete
MNKSIYNNLILLNIFITSSFITFKSKLYWYIIPITLSIIILLFDDKKNIKDDCLNNNINDPYLNLSNSQYTKLCKINPKKFFDFNLYTNHNDIFYNKNLERQFYTMPNIFNPPYNKDISNWLYNTVDNCKNNSDYCVPYKDTRFH